jgi:hypothetical protein
MQTVGLGGQIRFDSRVRSGGNLVDPSTYTINILNPLGQVVINAAVPVRDGVGLYHYLYTVPSNGIMGIWTAVWNGVVNGAAITNTETFNVTIAGNISTGIGVPSPPQPSFSDMLGDRQYASQYSTDAVVGFVVHKLGVPANADSSVTVSMQSLDGSTTVFSKTADNPAAGIYQTTLSSLETATPGIYRVTFNYTINGIAQVYVGLLEVGVSSPAYDALNLDMKGVVEGVWIRFADLFDSPTGGPHLQVYFQARFTRNRMAQLLRVAMNKLNTISQPHMTFTLDPGGQQFPLAQFAGILDSALYIEALKHLIRSYVEQPMPENVQVARQDRRDYMDRWQRVLDIELNDFTRQSEVFKMAYMGLSRPRVLVSGGVFGDFGPIRLPGNAVARPHLWAMYY